MRIGAIEAGGTKFVCGIGNEQGHLEDWCSFPTEHPETTLAKVRDYFRGKGVAAIGIGSFGPLDLQPDSPSYGCITTTPKPGWSNCNVVGILKREFGLPIGWDTDVNAAALGEVTWGAAQGLDNCVYYTIGTGVGVGLIAGGKRVHGLLHPEGGHIRTRRHPHDHFVGLCNYHGDCLEGLAAGPAIEARWERPGSELPTDHLAWEIESFYIAESITTSILLHSPQKVILGGGVMQQTHLFPMIRERVVQNINGYVKASELLQNIDRYIVQPGLGQQAGLYGALVLGMEALELATTESSYSDSEKDGYLSTS
ncbi:fructokinase [Paenibacillus sp. 4624]|uniref:fructokinase n=1 Tax=Paenibacillus amylolyticus TaxID=1451 RepID=A0A5M9WXB8_PAEAM|nr:ROK family protein [Paenibacillus amylolyticus]KAA8786149.1 ROK family protein [Paenibacillus amylolyticus]